MLIYGFDWFILDTVAPIGNKKKNLCGDAFIKKLIVASSGEEKILWSHDNRLGFKSGVKVTTRNFELFADSSTTFGQKRPNLSPARARPQTRASKSFYVKLRLHVVKDAAQ